jgi:hypothetical protein
MRSRQNVVDRDRIPPWLIPTVLASQMIALRHITAAEGNCCRRQAIVMSQADDLRDTQSALRGSDAWLVFRGRQLDPIFPPEKSKIVRVDDSRHVVPEHDECPDHGRHVDRLPVAIQH